MACHIAIVTRPYDELILSGRKTIECRMTNSRVPPFGQITPGEIIYFKRSSGPFFAVAEADCIWSTDNLSPARIEQIIESWNDGIHGEPRYFRARKSAKFATLIWLRDVRPCSHAPKYKPIHMRAWYTLPDDAMPVDMTPAPSIESTDQIFEIQLTAGSLRNGVISIAGHTDRFPRDCFGGRTARQCGRPIHLLLQDGPTMETDIVEHRSMLRGRRWRTWLNAHGLRAGDRLRFTPLGRRRFAVAPIRRSH